MPTWLGTVVKNGAPQQREFKYQKPQQKSGSTELSVRGVAYLNASESICHDFFAKSLLEDCIPSFSGPHDPADKERLRSNITASHDPAVDINYMKQLIATEKRVDMEQAAAIVLSALLTDKNLKIRDHIVRSLINGIDHSKLIPLPKHPLPRPPTPPPRLPPLQDPLHIPAQRNLHPPLRSPPRNFLHQAASPLRHKHLTSSLLLPRNATPPAARSLPRRLLHRRSGSALRPP